MSPALRRFSWGVLAYNIAVVVWGAYVRASGSGAGCGSHWPTCNGEVIPRAPRLQTIVEFSHRATSGVALLCVVALLIWTFARTPSGHPARRTSVWALVFILIEALIGAGLVLFDWVARNASMARGVVMGAHLCNTFLLLGALALTAWHLSGGPRVRFLRGRSGALFLLAFAGMFLTGASGGIAALGDTLFPAHTLAQGLAQDASKTASLFLRLRVFHPMFAVMTAAVVLACAGVARAAGGRARQLGVALVVAVGVQVGLGVLDLVLLAPIPLQLLHLTGADTVWTLLVLTAAQVAAQARDRLPSRAAA